MAEYLLIFFYMVIGVDQAQQGTSASDLTFNDEGMFP